MIGRSCTLASALIGLALAAPAAAGASNTYVDEDRPDNSGSCLTQATACRTIAGVDGGLAKSGPGDTVFVDGGTYNESFILGAGRSLIHLEFGAASDPPAIVNGGGMPAIEVPNGGFAGTVQGLTIRG